MSMDLTIQKINILRIVFICSIKKFLKSADFEQLNRIMVAARIVDGRGLCDKRIVPYLAYHAPPKSKKRG